MKQLLILDDPFAPEADPYGDVPSVPVTLSRRSVTALALASAVAVPLLAASGCAHTTRLACPAAPTASPKKPVCQHRFCTARGDHQCAFVQNGEG